MNRGGVLFRFSKDYRYYPGHVHGLAQPAFLATVEISEHAAKQAAHLDHLLAEHVLDIQKCPAAPIEDARGFAQRLAFWIGALQRSARIPTATEAHLMPMPGRVLPRFQLILPTVKPRATVIVLNWLAQTSDRIFAGSPALPSIPLEAVEKLYDALSLHSDAGVNRYLLQDAALRLGIPVFRPTPLFHFFGMGAHSHLVCSTATDQTSAAGFMLASDKQYTAQFLRQFGLPVPEQHLVDSSERAVEVAQSLGYPVVIKPADKERGLGVAADLRDASEVSSAYREAARHSSQILVEQWVAGHTHRLSVYKDKLIRVTRRIAGGVTGDGVHDIRALIDLHNQKRLRERGHGAAVRNTLTLDDEALLLLRRAGLTAAHVPAANTYIRLRRRDNINAGGWNEVVPMKEVHPDNEYLARDVARILSLDFAGVDLISVDVNCSWRENAAVICEVNAQPQLAARTDPDAYLRIVAQMMGDTWRIPVHLHIWPDADRHLQERITACQRRQGSHGISSRKGLWLGSRQISTVFSDSFKAARGLLVRPELHSADLVMNPRDLLRFGLPIDQIDQCSVAEPDLFSESERQALGQVQQQIRPHISPDMPDPPDPVDADNPHAEPLKALSRFSYDWAPLLCNRKSGCEFYHRAWSMVRFLETGGALPAGDAFFRQELVQSFRNGQQKILRRILICGAADTGLLAIVIQAIHDTGCEAKIILVDRCPTTLEQNRLYARYLNLPIELHQHDLLTFQCDPVDCIIVHSLMHFFAPDQRQAIVAMWARVLSDSGQVLLSHQLARQPGQRKPARDPAETDQRRMRLADKARSGGYSWQQAEEISQIAARLWRPGFNDTTMMTEDELRGMCARSGLRISRLHYDEVPPSTSPVYLPEGDNLRSRAEIVVRRTSGS